MQKFHSFESVSDNLYPWIDDGATFVAAAAG